MCQLDSGWDSKDQAEMENSREIPLFKVSILL